MPERDLEELFAAYLPRILQLAKYNLDSQLNAKFDENDIAATVMRTVFRRMASGTFTFEDDESLWKQLVVVTLNRIRNKVRHENALKRGGARATESIDEVRDVIAKEPDPADAVALVDFVQTICLKLDDVGQKVLELRMGGDSYSEIAMKLGVSDRAVGRKLQLIKQLINAN